MSHLPTWTIAEAKARFSHVIDQAHSEPQTITRNGRAGTLADFFAAAPLP
jgi:prevent-host-death family protein